MIKISSSWHKLKKVIKSLLCCLMLFFSMNHMSISMLVLAQVSQILKWINKNRQGKIIKIEILPFLRLRFSAWILLICCSRSLTACRKAFLFSSSFEYLSFHCTHNNDTKWNEVRTTKHKKAEEEEKERKPYRFTAGIRRLRLRHNIFRHF